MLSKIIIFVTRHNCSYLYDRLNSVVNCFQKLLSSWHDTTQFLLNFLYLLLWIAFKNYYLRDTTQHSLDVVHISLSCELLSKIIIFVTRHNLFLIRTFQVLVVNCFQKLLSSWHDTTYSNFMTINGLLWIAFKNYYLRDTTQLKKGKRQQNWGCELLSKIIIFVTRHNSPKSSHAVPVVVNCFQKLLSSWHDTTFTF